MTERNARAAMTVSAVLAAVVLHAGVVAQSPPPRPPITGIDHVAFRVSDRAAARRFYREVVGLSERGATREGLLIFAVGASQALQVGPGLPGPPGNDERLSHVALATPDVEALKRYLAARQVKAEPASGECAGNAIRVTDPDGHSIEFVQVEWPRVSAPADVARGGLALSSRLLHAGLIVRDEQAAHAFYRDILGLSEIWRGGSRAGVTSWVNMRLPEGTDYIEYMLQADAPDRRQRGVLHHICLRVPDIQEAWNTVAARSVAAGQKAPAPPSVGRNGKWQLNLYDPDGTRVELMEPFTTR